MMKKILMVDYYGACDKEGRATGHSPKVAKEYREFFSEEDQVDIAASPCIAEAVKTAGFQNIYKLPYDIFFTDYNKLLKRILDKFKILFNIYQVFRITGYDIIWFYRTDFFFFLYMIFAGKAKPKRICLVYQMGGGKGIVEKIIGWVYNKGVRKFDGVIYTQEKMQIPAERKFYMPDYLYEKIKYDQYVPLHKEKKAVCLGTMSPYKKLEELVDVFNECGYSLEITGYFFDKERAIRLRKKAKENISIEDCILNEEDYYKKLGSASYAILPYDMEQYKNRTSGILLECAFLGVVPVAPDSLLKANSLPGIGYTSIHEISAIISSDIDLRKIYDDQKRVRFNFDAHHIRDEFNKWLDLLQ